MTPTKSPTPSVETNQPQIRQCHVRLYRDHATTAALFRLHSPSTSTAANSSPNPRRGAILLPADPTCASCTSSPRSILSTPDATSRAAHGMRCKSVSFSGQDHYFHIESRATDVPAGDAAATPPRHTRSAGHQHARRGAVSTEKRNAKHLLHFKLNRRTRRASCSSFSTCRRRLPTAVKSNSASRKMRPAPVADDALTPTTTGVGADFFRAYVRLQALRNVDELLLEPVNVVAQMLEGGEATRHSSG